MQEETIKQVLSQRAGDGSDAGRNADAVLAAMRLLHFELGQVVGSQAAAALCARALHRTRSKVGWTMPAATLTDKMLEALRGDLAARSPAACLFAGETLLYALVDHLISLIGEPLTLRMLRSAWSPPAADPTSLENL